nr:DUF2269 family protein [Sphingomonas bacterium]
MLVGACWLPVVAIQLRMRRIANSTPDGQALPALYHRLSRWRFALGWPAFTGVIAIYWLMVAKPNLWLARRCSAACSGPTWTGCR